MDIEEWYAADQRRRQGRELAFGRGWAQGSPPQWLADLFWNELTGELFLLRKPVPPAWLPIVSPDDLRRWLAEIQDLGAEVAEAARHVLHPRHRRARAGEPGLRDGPANPANPEPAGHETEDEADIEPLGVVGSRSELEEMLAGWQRALPEVDSLGWLRGRLGRLGVVGPAPDRQPPPTVRGAQPR